MNLNDLNREQRIAAETLEGPVLVLAGAGTGKTKMLTYRVANLIDHGVSPYHIMAITFTNKAAAEMKSRIISLVGEAGNEVWVSTFHSACAKILRRDIEKLGYKRNFVIYDDNDQDVLLKQILAKMNLDQKEYQLRTVKSMISQAKQKLLNPKEWLKSVEFTQRNERISEIYQMYEVRMKENNALDFNDLINKTLELFTMHPPVLQYYHHLIRYLHVDEYQDTDYAQYMLVTLLAQEERNLCVVGDDDQSIYSWRGADIRNIQNFQVDFPEAKVIKLERNYRSSANILDAANQVITGNKNRMDKSLWTEREDGDKIVLCTVNNEYEEAEWVAGTVDAIRKTGESYSGCAVLYRSNAQSRVIEEKFMSSGIPYRIYGGLRFYDRQEIKDALAYIRLIINPTDDVSLRRIINVPKRGIGDTSADALFDYALEEQIPVLSACMSLPEDFNSRARKKISEFADLIMELTLSSEQESISEFVKTMIDRTGLRAQYEKEKTEEANSRMENLDEFVNAVTEFASRNPESTLQEFIETTALESSFDQIGEEEGVVTLMTVHGAKGLEYPNVFMVGMEETLFPSFMAMQLDENVEEERRLCYVGITRAEHRLFLSHANYRTRRGQTEGMCPSRFLEDIPERLLREVEFNRYESRNFDYLGNAKATDAVKPLWNQKVTGGTMGKVGKGWGSGTSAFQSKPKQTAKVELGGKTIEGVQKGFTQKRVSSAAAGQTATLEVGDRIIHKLFGKGEIIGIEPSGSDNNLSIKFDTGLKKTFKQSLAALQKLEE